VDIVYAPFEVRDRTTNKVLAQIINNGKGGRLQMLDADGSVVATIGTSLKGPGAVAIYNREIGLVGLSFDEGASAGDLSILTPSYKKIADLAPGDKGQMGLRIYNPSGAEVVTLEDLPGGSGGGGLMIHNAAGGPTATIATGKNGAGLIHGILVGPAIGAAW
jgi:hypothetical protein